MSTPRFLADEDLRRAIVNATRRLEPTLEFIRIQEFGLSGQDDPAVLEYAWANDLLVVSHDVNTMPQAAKDRMARGQDLSGLLLVPQDRRTRLIAEELLLIWSASQAGEYRNRIVFLPL